MNSSRDPVARSDQDSGGPTASEMGQQNRPARGCVHDQKNDGQAGCTRMGAWQAPLVWACLRVLGALGPRWLEEKKNLFIFKTPL
jgi:hypothetical protein